MIQFSEIIDRIEQIRTEKGMSRKAFCQWIVFPYPRYHHIAGNRGSKPTLDLVHAVANQGNISVEWLLFGEEKTDKTKLAFSAEASTATHLNKQYVLLPLYSIEGSAGMGTINHEESIEDLLAFKEEWIRNELRASPGNLMLIRVQGESMTPTLNPGDVILVEKSSELIAGDGIYVIRMSDVLLVKRLQFLPDKRVMVKSDNSAYQSYNFDLKGTTEGDFAIIGKVVWGGRRF